MRIILLYFMLFYSYRHSGERRILVGGCANNHRIYCVRCKIDNQKWRSRARTNLLFIVGTISLWTEWLCVNFWFLSAICLINLYTLWICLMYPRSVIKTINAYINEDKINSCQWSSRREREYKYPLYLRDQRAFVKESIRSIVVV